MNSSPLESRAVLLTPAGRGAVATVVVQGPNVAQSLDKWFQPASGRSLSESPLRRIILGRWGTSGGAMEELVVCRLSNEQIEIHCHGGLAAADNVLSPLAAAGFVPLDWNAWLRGEEGDRLKAEARVALAAARTERTARVLLDQYQGALQSVLEQAAQASELGAAAEAERIIQFLLRFENVGRRLTRPFRVVLAGPPNVGKSSLLNALLGFERAIVFDEPGTTRDVLTGQTAFDGWPVELADTAGLREAGEQIEAAGVAKARQELAAADLVLLVFDGSQPWSATDQMLVDGAPLTIVIHNKSDLEIADSPMRAPGIATSAKTMVGLDELARQIVGRLVPDPPPTGAAVPFVDELIADLHAALGELRIGNFVTAKNHLEPWIT